MSNSLVERLLQARAANEPQARPLVALREIELRYRPGRLVEEIPAGPFSSPRVVADAFRELARSPREIFVVIHMDSQNRPIAYDVAAVGSGDAALVCPKDVLRPLLYTGASGAVFVHSHPSGNPQPSPEDIQVTRRLREILALCGLRFLDHVVLGENGTFFSFAEEGV